MNCFDRHLYSHNSNKGYWEYHLEWCPKYRFNVLRKDGIRKECEEILFGIAKQLDVKVEELAVMPDHVHMSVVCKEPYSIPYLLFRFKGASSHELFKRHPNFRKRYPKGHFWSPGKFSRTVSVSSEVVRSYIRRQKDIHQTSLGKWTS
jgi:putative transposase